MFPPPILLNIISGAAGSTVLLSLAIIFGTFFLEDATIVLVGILSSDGTVSLPLALFSLYAGVILGDIFFYYIGWLASTHPRLEKYVDHDYVAPFRAWLEGRYILTIFSARFIPGSRLPTYAASGFLRSPFYTFVLTAIVATSIWTTLLFFISYWFGSITAVWLEKERWVIVGVFILILLFVARHNLLAIKKLRDTVVEKTDI